MDDKTRTLFFLLTAKMEDGSGSAAEGQTSDMGAYPADGLAKRIHSIGQECVVLADSARIAKRSSPRLDVHKKELNENSDRPICH